MNNLRLELHLCFAIYTTWSVINRTYKPLLDQLDLTYTQYIVLAALWENDNQNVKRLGEKLYLGSNTLTPVLKRLESKELIQRVRDASDDRLLNVILTVKGRKMSSAAKDIPFCIPEVTGLSIDYLSELNDQIQDLRSRITRGTNQ